MGLDMTNIGGELSKTLTQLVNAEKPLTIIETGTYLGNGSTAAFCRGIMNQPRIRCTFYSIEVNIRHYQQALTNLHAQGILSFVQVLYGLSIPRHMLPNGEDVAKEIDDAERKGKHIDHQHKEDQVDRYLLETENQACPDDLLGLALASCHKRPDILFLDSAGHMGNIEFQYVLKHLAGPCTIVLDDVNHLKHCRSLEFMQQDGRFEILKHSNERYGYCVAKYVPGQMNADEPCARETGFN